MSIVQIGGESPDSCCFVFVLAEGPVLGMGRDLHPGAPCGRWDGSHFQLVLLGRGEFSDFFGAFAGEIGWIPRGPRGWGGVSQSGAGNRSVLTQWGRGQPYPGMSGIWDGVEFGVCPHHICSWAQTILCVPARGAHWQHLCGQM